jgi:hypothetical protein
MELDHDILFKPLAEDEKIAKLRAAFADDPTLMLVPPPPPPMAAAVSSSSSSSCSSSSVASKKQQAAAQMPQIDSLIDFWLSEMKTSATNTPFHSPTPAEKIQMTRHQMGFSKEVESAIDKAMLNNASSKEFSEMTLAEDLVKRFVELGDCVEKVPLSAASTLAVDLYKVRRNAALPEYTPDELEQLTFAITSNDDTETPCALGEKCIGKMGVLRRDSSVPRDMDVKVVFMARKQPEEKDEEKKKSGMCVLDEMLAFSRYIFAKRPLLEKAVVSKNTLIALYRVCTDAARGGFHPSRLLHPSPEYEEGFFSPVPRFNKRWMRLTMDKTTKRLRADLSEMKLKPETGLDVVLFNPVHA